MKATRLLIGGMVQGVGYRFFTQRVARNLGIRGYVRNLPDGRVEAVAAGPAGKLQAFVDQVRAGPSGAWVSDVESTEVDLDDSGSHGFEIRT
jgi:acylphosphatase